METNKELVNRYLETPEVWQNRLQLLQILMVEFASSEPDEDVISEGIIAILEDIEESNRRFQHWPYNVFRLKTEDRELEIRITAEVKPREQQPQTDN